MRTPDVLLPCDDDSPVVRVKKRVTATVFEDEEDDFVGKFLYNKFTVCLLFHMQLTAHTLLIQ